MEVVMTWLQSERFYKDVAQLASLWMFMKNSYVTTPLCTFCTYFGIWSYSITATSLDISTAWIILTFTGRTGCPFHIKFNSLWTKRTMMRTVPRTAQCSSTSWQKPKITQGKCCPMHMQSWAFKNENNSGHQWLHWDLKARQYRLI